MIAGMDACRAGWVAVVQSDAHFEVEVVDGLEHLLRRHPNLAVIAIDIPIGLSEFAPRECDLMTRRELSPRGSVVFPAPLRPVVAMTSYHSAKEVNLGINGKGISQQAFAIYNKVNATDIALQNSDNLRRITYEVHPERCFMAMNNNSPLLAPKKTERGRQIRISLVTELIEEGLFEALRPKLKKSQAADDDILDALAALWTARRIQSGISKCNPSNPPTDSKNLPMRICY